MNIQTRALALIVLGMAFGSVSAEDKEVEPTQSAIDYMEKLDTHMGDNLGGNDKVDAWVTEKDSGEQVIHMDYSESEGAVIRPEPFDNDSGNRTAR